MNTRTGDTKIDDLVMMLSIFIKNSKLGSAKSSHLIMFRKSFIKKEQVLLSVSRFFSFIVIVFKRPKLRSSNLSGIEPGPLFRTKNDADVKVAIENDSKYEDLLFLDITPIDIDHTLYKAEMEPQNTDGYLSGTCFCQMKMSVNVFTSVKSFHSHVQYTIIAKK